MRVFKFGGASVKDAESVRNVAEIVKNSPGKLIVVVSAMGKTTNNLEKIVNAYVHQKGDAQQYLEEAKDYHKRIVQSLFEDDYEAVWDQINDIFVEIEWILEDSVHDSYDYLYDQIVSVGELVSTTILAYYLSKIGCSSTWLDARGVIITDETHRAGVVDFKTSQEKIRKAIDRGHASFDVIVSQGFIGSTPDNNSVTLGREGSDYSAGIFSYCTDAESMHIWKDVPGILTADPRLFDHTTKIDRLSYREAIEMTYYGAKVIHPKTIKPLQNKSIPLYVRPFDNPQSEGTLISSEGSDTYPPMIVVEPNQSLLYISTKDFSFVAEHHLKEIFGLLSSHHIKVNMMRNTAISFTVSTNTDEAKINRLIHDLQDRFNVVLDQGLELITIRHYDQLTIDHLKEGRLVLFEESLRNTYQMVTKELPTLSRKK